MQTQNKSYDFRERSLFMVDFRAEWKEFYEN